VQRLGHRGALRIEHRGFEGHEHPRAHQTVTS
jgi:hypothetical protein